MRVADHSRDRPTCDLQMHSFGTCGVFFCSADTTVSRKRFLGIQQISVTAVESIMMSAEYTVALLMRINSVREYDL